MSEEPSPVTREELLESHRLLLDLITHAPVRRSRFARVLPWFLAACAVLVGRAIAEAPALTNLPWAYFSTTRTAAADGKYTPPACNALGVLSVAHQPVPLGTAPTYINATASNGTTAVVLVAAGTSSQQVFPLKLFIANTSTTVGHTVTIQSATTTARAIKLQLPVSASFAWDGDIALSWGTIAGEGLNFLIDSGGAAADVTVSGSASVQ